MNNIFDFISLMFLGCGLYCLYGWYKMKISGEINEVLLLGKHANAGKCKDKKAYLSKVMPAVLIFGIVTTIYGGVDALNLFVFDRDPTVTIIDNILMGIFGITFIWYIIYTSRLRKQFFS